MRGSRASQRAKHHLLLVAAGELAHLLLDRGRADAEAARQRRDQPALGAAIEEAEPRDLLRHAQGDVVAHAAQQQQRFLLAVLGHEADAGQDRIGRARSAAIWPKTRISPPSSGSMPKAARASSVRPAPTRPPSPTISPARTLSEQSRTFAVVTAAQLQRHLVAHPRAMAEQVTEIPADHQAHHGGLVDLGSVADRHQLAVAQHGDPVGQIHDLAQAVADVDDADALGAQRADHREQALRLVLGQRRGRLVQAEQPHAGPQGAHDLDQLPLGRAQAVAGGAPAPAPARGRSAPAWRSRGGAGRPSRRTPPPSP